MGVLATFKGAKEEVHAARERRGHAGSDEHRIHEILAETGPHAAMTIVRCED